MSEACLPLPLFLSESPFLVRPWWGHRSEFSGLMAQEQSPFNRVNDFIRRLKTEGKEAVKPPDFLLVSGALAARNSFQLVASIGFRALGDRLYLGLRACIVAPQILPCFLCLCPAGWLDVTASCAMKLAYHLEGLVDDVQLVIATWNHAGVQHARFYEGAVSETQL